MKAVNSYATVAQRRVFATERERIPAEVQEIFDVAFAAWKATWFSGGLAISSDPETRAVGREYENLVALGPAILPLVVEQLADPENFLAVTLYDAIQANEQLLVKYEAGDERILEGEQGRAQRVVQAWFAHR